METGRGALGFLLDLVSRGGLPAPHDSTEMYAEFEPDAQAFGDHELEGLITRSNRYGLTLCVDGRIYEVVLRAATAVHPANATVEHGVFARIHGSWAPSGFQANTITLIA